MKTKGTKMNRGDAEGAEKRQGERARSRVRAFLLGACAAVTLTLAPAARGNIMAPLAYDTASGIVDEFGNLLEGTGTSPGARVEILSADDGVFPPESDGTPHPSNAVLAVAQIGMGIDPGVGAVGKVSGALVINRMQGTKLFARVFNKPTREASSFYGDSNVYTNPTAKYEVFMIELAQTDQPMDDGDDDGDGLVNSWEKSWGTDKDDPDTDGDGMSDQHEVRAGTNPLDAGSFLEMVRLKPGTSAGTLVVEWDAVNGKVYQLQHAVLTTGDEDFAFTNVNTAVTAGGPVASTIVTNLPPGAFRVQLVE